MKKLLLLIALFVVSVSAMAQTSNATANVEIVKSRAEKWFQDVYVNASFKDPYSYRLMGVKVIPITAKEAFAKDLIVIQHRMNACTLAESDRTQEQLDKCMGLYEEGEVDARKEQEFIDKGVDVDYHKKRLAIFREYNVKYLEWAKEISLYLLDVKAKTNLESILEKIPQNEADKLVFYDIQLDCYQKNSLGNEVLFRCVFPFTIDGPLGDKNGMDTVRPL